MLNRVVKYFVFLTLICSLPTTAEEKKNSPPTKLKALEWLAGKWVSKGSPAETEEHWIEPKGGVMLGVNRTVVQSQARSFEFLRIAETKQGIVYFASPGGGKPTPFALKSLGKQKVIFENEKHDFPQRIYYTRAGNKLDVKIEGTINGKPQSMSWQWHKQ